MFKQSQRHSAVLPCEPTLAYEILVDYDNYIEWLPFVAHSKLLAREGDLALAEFKVISPPADITVECVHTKNRSVLSRKISGNIPFQQMVWTLTPKGGAETEVCIEITRETNWKHFLPWGSRFPSGGAYLQALRSRVAVFSGDFRLEDEAGRKILEIFETDEGLDVWIMGKKYLLKAEEKESND